MNPKVRLAFGIGGGLLVGLLAGNVVAGRRLPSTGGQQVVEEPAARSSTAAPTATPQQASAPAANESGRVLLSRADAAVANHALVEAKELYRQALQQNPDAQTAAAAQQRLGQVNVELLLSPTLTPDAGIYIVEPGDTLGKIARRSSTTVELLRASNRIGGDFIRVGQQLKVAKARFNVVVDKSQNTLTLKNGEEVVKVYRCSTGAGGITPAGAFKIASRMVDPVWKGIVAPGDPENPLGSRWMGFDIPEYGIHGTNKPDSIGKPVTKGCVRLLNSEAEELYTLLPEGTPVTIVD